MGKLPPMLTTYEKVFKLFVDSYLYALPFILLAVLNQYLMVKMSSVYLAPHQPVSAQIIIALLLFYLVAILINCCTMFAIFQVFRGSRFDYTEIILQGLKRSLPILGAVLLILVMCIVVGIVFFIPAPMLSAMIFEKTSVIGPLITALSYLIGLGVLLTIFIYYYLAGILIICKGLGPVDGMARSWQLVRGFWWKTLFLVVVLNIPYFIFSVTMSYYKLMPNYYISPLSMLIMTSLNIALVIIHCAHLEEAHLASPMVASSDKVTLERG